MTKFASLAAGLAFVLASSAMAVPQNQNVMTSDNQAMKATQTQPAVKPGDPHCLQDTGSLIKPRPGQCLPGSGRSYSKQDIDRTGARTLGPALKDLDPSVTLQH